MIHIVSYYYGAISQIQRYYDSYDILRTNSIQGVQLCFTELSSLLEHLTSIEKYLLITKMTIDTPYSWSDYRNYLRHDIRENFEKYTSKRKLDRCAKFHIDNSTIEFQLEFKREAIIFGDKNIILTFEDVNKYLNKVKNIMENEIDTAEKLGFFKSESAPQSNPSAE